MSSSHWARILAWPSTGIICALLTDLAPVRRLGITSISAGMAYSRCAAPSHFPNCSTSGTWKTAGLPRGSTTTHSWNSAGCRCSTRARPSVRAALPSTHGAASRTDLRARRGLGCLRRAPNTAPGAQRRGGGFDHRADREGGHVSRCEDGLQVHRAQLPVPAPFLPHSGQDLTTADLTAPLPVCATDEVAQAVPTR